MLEEFFGDLGGLLRGGVFRDGVERSGAGALRIGVRDVAAETFAAEDHDETVFFNGLDEDFDAGNLDVLEDLHDFSALFGRNTTRATVGDESVFVDRAEVAADANVVRADRERDTRGFENAATDLEDERIVSKEAKVTRAATGGNAGKNRKRHAADAFLRKRVKVRGVRRFKFGQSARLQREAADTVGDYHNNLSAVGLQRLNQFVQFHNTMLLP